MKVFVIGLNGIGLMPTTPAKARKLLKAGKARVAQKKPFTIQLLYKTGSAVQPLYCGIDTGSQHIGLAVADENGNILHKADLELRKTMEKKKLLETRKTYRRGRRYRKTRYRRPKTRHRRKRVYSAVPDSKGRHWHTVKPEGMMSYGRPEGWTPPSIQSKIDHHIGWIRRYMKALPKDTVFTIETARFDVQHMKDPSVRGEEYQHGRMYGFENVKAYVLAKFNYTCPVCGHKFDRNHKPRMHHVAFRKNGATDNPDEYAPVCEKCHTAAGHLPGGELDKLRRACKRKEYREPAFMNILGKRLRAEFPNARFTYGNITKADREDLGLTKTHANDAVAIALHGTGIKHVSDPGWTLFIKQVRRKKRSLHEANPRKGRSGKKNTAAWRESKNKKSVKGFSVYDTVEYNGQKAYITGFTGSSAYAVNFDGDYILYTAETGRQYRGVPLSKLRLLEKRTDSYISEMRRDG